MDTLTKALFPGRGAIGEGVPLDSDFPEKTQLMITVIIMDQKKIQHQAAR